MAKRKLLAVGATDYLDLGVQPHSGSHAANAPASNKIKLKLKGDLQEDAHLADDFSFI